MIIFRQLEFARRDYEGLNEVQKLELRKRRDELAKKLMEKRRRNNLALEQDQLRDKKDYENILESLKRYRKKLWGEDSEEYKEKMKKSEEDLKKTLKGRLQNNIESRNTMHTIFQKNIEDSAERERDYIKNQSFLRKVGNYNKALWNGDVGLSKGANRALMIGVPTAIAAGTGLAIHKHSKNKKKKEEEENKKK